MYQYYHHRAKVRRERLAAQWPSFFPDPWRTMLEEMWDGVLVANGDRLAYVNQPLCQLLGYSPAELVTTSEAVFPPEWPGLRTLFDALCADAVCDTPTGDLELEITRKDGERRWVFARYAVHCRGDDCRMVFVVMTDITERRRAFAEQEQHIRDLEAFAKAVAHGLKGPLTLIRASAEIMLCEEAALSEAERHTYLNQIARGERTLQNIIQELLLLAGLTEQVVTLQPFDMDTVVNAALERLAFMISDRVAMVLKAEQWPLVVGYAPWIEEVWVNYISNALKYGGVPPVIQLGASVMENDQVRFWVCDNGPGLTEAQRADLFQPFKRLTNQPVTGDGLGLSIVRHIVEKLGGGVDVTNGPLGGCEFGFTLPRAL